MTSQSGAVAAGKNPATPIFVQGMTPAQGLSLKTLPFNPLIKYKKPNPSNSTPAVLVPPRHPSGAVSFAKDAPQPQQLTLAADISPSVEAAPWAIDVSRPGGPGVLIGFLDGESGLAQQVCEGGGSCVVVCCVCSQLGLPHAACTHPSYPSCALHARTVRRHHAHTLELCSHPRPTSLLAHARQPLLTNTLNRRSNAFVPLQSNEDIRGAVLAQWAELLGEDAVVSNVTAFHVVDWNANQVCGVCALVCVRGVGCVCV